MRSKLSFSNVDEMEIDIALRNIAIYNNEIYLKNIAIKEINKQNSKAKGG